MYKRGLRADQTAGGRQGRSMGTKRVKGFICIQVDLNRPTVSQGSILGPILFLLYTADLLQLVKRHHLMPHAYALQTTPTFMDVVSHPTLAVLLSGS